MKTKLLMAILMILGLGGALKANAQNWSVGEDPASVSTTDEDNDKVVNVVLYNVATQQYVGGSGMWGTQVYCLPSGKYFKVYESDATYKFTFTQSSGKRSIGWGESNADKGFLFINSTNNGRYMTFKSVTVEGKTNVYKISLSDNGKENTVWLTSNGSNNAVTWSSTEPADDNTAAQWMIISESRFVDAFNNAAEATNLEVTYANGTNLLKDPVISAYDSEASNWIVSGSNVRALNYSSTNRKYVSNLADAEISDGTETTDNYIPSSVSGSYNYVYAGEGYGSASQLSITADDDNKTISSVTGVNEGDGDLITYEDYVNYNKDNRPETYVGKYWTANIHGKANVYQTISATSLYEGTYTIYCKGFTSGEANLYVKVNGTTQKTALTKLEEADKPATYALAGKALLDAGYTHSVSIYVPENTTSIEVGIEGVSGWTCFNDFRIIYFGIDREPYLYFNEDDVTMENLKAQVNNQKHCLYLRRKLTDNQWNSLVLPLDVKAPQIRSAFGEDTKLAKLRGIDEDMPYTIKYDLVDLTKNDNGIEAGQLYIIWPSKIAPVEIPDGGKVIDRVNGSDNKDAVKVTIYNENAADKSKAPVFYIRNVAFKALPENIEENGITTPQSFKVVNNKYFTGLIHYGALVNTKQCVAPGSILLNSTGKWYHTKDKTYDIRGFRTWIDTTKAEEGAEIKLEVNGVVEGGGVVTGIGNVEINTPVAAKSQNVYDLNGRVIRTDGSTEGLAKGIYILNGKKIIK